MERIIVKISLSEDGKQYKIESSEGMSLNEMMFGVAAAIRCLVRDGVIEKHEIATEMLLRYLTDSQYDEVQDTVDNEVTE